MRIGCLQFSPGVGEVESNIRRADSILDAACTEDLSSLDLLVLPELALTGYNFRSLHDISRFLEFQGSGISGAWARSAALKYDTRVVIGYPEKVDISDEWPANPEYYNSAVFVNADGDVVSNYRKTFLYRVDEKWALEGDRGFTSTRVPELGRVAIGICMDINPYRFEADWEAFEFASYVLRVQADLVILSMAWSTVHSAENFCSTPLAPDIETLTYWIQRLEPIIKADSDRETIVVFCNRTGIEDDAVYTGTSTVVGIKNNEVSVYGILGRGTEELLVVDTADPPVNKMVYRTEIADPESRSELPRTHNATSKNESPPFSDDEPGKADMPGPGDANKSQHRLKPGSRRVCREPQRGLKSDQHSHQMEPLGEGGHPITERVQIWLEGHTYIPDQPNLNGTVPSSRRGSPAPALGTGQYKSTKHPPQGRMQPKERNPGRRTATLKQTGEERNKSGRRSKDTKEPIGSKEARIKPPSAMDLGRPANGTGRPTAQRDFAPEKPGLKQFIERWNDTCIESGSVKLDSVLYSDGMPPDSAGLDGVGQSEIFPRDSTSNISETETDASSDDLRRPHLLGERIDRPQTYAPSINCKVWREDSYYPPDRRHVRLRKSASSAALKKGKVSRVVGDVVETNSTQASGGLQVTQDTSNWGSRGGQRQRTTSSSTHLEISDSDEELVGEAVPHDRHLPTRKQRRNLNSQSRDFTSFRVARNGRPHPSLHSSAMRNHPSLDKAPPMSSPTIFEGSELGFGAMDDFAPDDAIMPKNLAARRGAKASGGPSWPRKREVASRGRGLILNPQSRRFEPTTPKAMQLVFGLDGLE